MILFQTDTALYCQLTTYQQSVASPRGGGNPFQTRFSDSCKSDEKFEGMGDGVNDKWYKPGLMSTDEVAYASVVDGSLSWLSSITFMAQAMCVCENKCIQKSVKCASKYMKVLWLLSQHIASASRGFWATPLLVVRSTQCIDFVLDRHVPGTCDSRRTTDSGSNDHRSNWRQSSQMELYNK